MTIALIKIDHDFHKLRMLWVICNVLFLLVFISLCWMRNRRLWFFFCLLRVALYVCYNVFEPFLQLNECKSVVAIFIQKKTRFFFRVNHISFVLFVWFPILRENYFKGISKSSYIKHFVAESIYYYCDANLMRQLFNMFFIWRIKSENKTTENIKKTYTRQQCQTLNDRNIIWILNCVMLLMNELWPATFFLDISINETRFHDWRLSFCW